MNYLKRRFSSSDIQRDLEDDPGETPLVQTATNFFNFSSNRKAPSPSAPASPSKSSLTNIAGNISGGISKGLFSGKTSYNKDRCKVLLVVDDHHTDWSKYFRGRKILGDYDLRVEQAEFKDINLAAYSNQGCMITVNSGSQTGHGSARSFKPDFALILQHATDANISWRNIVIGLRYAHVPCLNSIESVYCMMDKPWVYASLLGIQRRLGKEQFPLIEQAYFPNHQEMLSSFWTSPSKFPVVVKVGNAHNGVAKVKVDNSYDFQDTASIVAVTDCYTTTEQYYESKYDIHIQKIGTSYKAFMRKSISGNWKANTGSAVLEQITMNEIFKLWIDEVSELFGGLSICAIQAIQSKDGRQYIIEAKGSSMSLLGESQEDDRRLIGDLVLQEMQASCRAPNSSFSSSNRRMQVDTGLQPPQGPPMNSMPSSPLPVQPPQPELTFAQREAGLRDLQDEDEADTMTNLKRTFAGIFGDL